MYRASSIKGTTARLVVIGLNDERSSGVERGGAELAR
jgi:hypothetical protein